MTCHLIFMVADHVGDAVHTVEVGELRVRKYRCFSTRVLFFTTQGV